MRRRPPRLAGVILLFIAVSCGGGGATNPPVDNTPAKITISPSTPLTLASGATATLTAAVTTSDGRAVSGAAVLWSSSDPTVATVNGGLVTAIKAGTATITATAGSVSATLSVTVTAPTRFIVLDSTTIVATTQQGSNPATRTIRITNGGSGAFAGVTVDPIVFDAGQPTGWLTATVTGTNVPFTLTLSFAATTLPVGTYHATVVVNAPGATNTPQSISVTLTVVPVVTFGTNTEKVRVLDAAGAYTPTLTATIDGVQQPTTAVNFTSRATTVATVNANGRITAVGPGQSWIVATIQGAADSVFVIVPRSASGPLLRADLATYSVRSGDTITVTFTLDPRATPVAGATVVVGYETENNMFTLLSATIPTQTPMPIAVNSTQGVFKVTVASATALAAPVAMLQLKLIARGSGLSGFLTFTALDIVGPDGTDVSPQTTSTRYPIIIR